MMTSYDFEKMSEAVPEVRVVVAGRADTAAQRP